MSQVQTHSRATAAYRDAEAHPPARQIVLLHESAIRNLLDAKLAIAERRIEDRFHRVAKAHAIVGALQSCLDFELGGEIAPLLDRLYDHILGRLMAINLQDDPAICDEIVHCSRACGTAGPRSRAGLSRQGRGALRPASPSRRPRRCRPDAETRAGRPHGRHNREPSIARPVPHPICQP